MKYVILAGGSGTRLWPLSRKSFAKQFIKLTDNSSMLQNTALRVSKEKGKDVFVISNPAADFIIHDQLKEVLPQFETNNLIIEPEGRNTAPAIAYGSLFFNPDDIIVILSSDHYIKNTIDFNNKLEQAGEIAKNGHIVTLGLIPDAPKTGYGYIKKDNEKIKNGYKVERFVEKPDETTARKYLAEGGYFWNAGIFIFKAATLWQELQLHAPELYQVTEKLRTKVENRQPVTLADYQAYNKISIDYAVMEKSQNIVVLPSDFGWNDIGSYGALFDILEKDQNGNIINIDPDNFSNIDSQNLLVYGNKRKIAAIGLENLIIVDTPDAILISDKNRSEEVKTAVEEFAAKGAREAENHLLEHTPWGTIQLLASSKNYMIQQLTVQSGKKLSFKNKADKTIQWTVVSGDAKLTYASHESSLEQSQSIQLEKDIDYILENSSPDCDLIVIQTVTRMGSD